MAYIGMKDERTYFCLEGKPVYFESEFARMYKNQRKTLIKYLKSINVSENTIESMLDSRYYCYNDDLPPPYQLDGYRIYDGFVGSRISDSLNSYITVPDLRQYIINFDKNGYTGSLRKYPYLKTEVHDVMDIANAVESLKSAFHSRVGKISYRGSSMMYMLKRKFPNPIFCISNGEEYSLIPSFFRVYNGQNQEQLGLYFYNILEAMSLNYIADAQSLFQHYGYGTVFLDVTFDVIVSLFFALNKLVIDKNGFYDYVPLNKNEYQNAVLYVLCVDMTDDLFDYNLNNLKVPVYENEIIALRPQRQNSTTLRGDFASLNKAASEIIGVITFAKDFTIPKEMYDKRYLFPSPEEDEAYRFLIECENITDAKFKEMCKDMANSMIGEESTIITDQQYEFTAYQLRLASLLKSYGQKIMRFNFHK